MSRGPLVTTIIPTYNRPLLLKRAVLSVVNQSCPDFVVQILDNASSGETECVARALARADSRVQYHRHTTNMGSLNNIIHGIERVTTPYFSILCDDDLLMPDFYADGLAVHDAGARDAAFVSARVLAVDPAGRVRAVGNHPPQTRRMLPPDGFVTCVKAGASMPGVIYRTGAVRQIGPPRIAWWNWTETGWNALMAIDAPIEFFPRVGAIIYDHPDSGSKKMDRIEFRLSWFRMLAEVRQAVLQHPRGAVQWDVQVRSFAYTRFVGTVVRMSIGDGPRQYDALRSFAIASGVSEFSASALIGVARAASRLGVGALVNGVWDYLTERGFRSSPMPVAVSDGQEASNLARPLQIYRDLNRQAGIEVPSGA